MAMDTMPPPGTPPAPVVRIREIRMTRSRVARLVSAPTHWAANRKVMASIMPLPSLLIWEPRGMVKPETFRSTSRSSAHCRFTGTQAREELVLRVVTISGRAFFRKCRGFIPVKTNSRIRYRHTCRAAAL